MSSPSLSDSPGTFKVDCNVVETFLKNRPKFKFLQNSSDFFFFFLSSFFYQHGNLLNQRTARVGFYIIPLCLAQGLEMSLQKKQGQRTKWKTKSTCRHCVGLWFDAILIYAHVISMNTINLTTQS